MIPLLGASAAPPGDQVDLIRAYTRGVEFDYVSWMLNALSLKAGRTALSADSYLEDGYPKQVVLEYLALIGEIQGIQAQLNDVYANPDIEDPDEASTDLRERLEILEARRDLLEPLAESIVQRQVAVVVSEMDLAVGGQPLPPVLYRVTPIPMALIVSPRHTIRQVADISLNPGLTAGEQAELEEQVDQGLDVSSLVVPIGGIGVYPTMVMQTTDINWLMEVVAHEWIHNFLTLRPLGMNYLTSAELRIMNETTAAIAGKEIGSAVIARYYPELAPPPLPPPPPPPSPEEPAQPPSPPVFDFRSEMHETRVTVDAMLAAGKIEEAEEYMEMRRQFFWDHGYHIRKLNQAYFAFYGAYADQPGGAAGEDPVGAAVRTLRAESSSLAAFVRRIAWITSFEALKQEVAKSPGETQPGSGY